MDHCIHDNKINNLKIFKIWIRKNTKKSQRFPIKNKKKIKTAKNKKHRKKTKEHRKKTKEHRKITKEHRKITKDFKQKIPNPFSKLSKL